MRLSPDQRSLIADANRRGIKTMRIAEVFGVACKTVRKWIKRTTFKDRKRKPKQSKVTIEVELSILGIRNTFGWGTARIQQGLVNLPPYMREVQPVCVQKVRLSRTTINAVLRKHGLNGYKRKHKSWKFFRAKKPNELWQLDIKGPFIVQSKKYWFLVCIDDYSRYLLVAEQLTHMPSTDEVQTILLPYVRKHRPQSILTDNNPFKQQWDQWCKANNIQPLHAHPYYPQDKGKVEREIRNLTEEFVNLLRKFPQWLNGKIKKYRSWRNNKRFHRGINNYPAKLFWELRNFT